MLGKSFIGIIEFHMLIISVALIILSYEVVVVVMEFGEAVVVVVYKV
jgi:hypothetical protein